jgi:hypothetical protein
MHTRTWGLGHPITCKVSVDISTAGAYAVQGFVILVWDVGHLDIPVWLQLWPQAVDLVMIMVIPYVRVVIVLAFLVLPPAYYIQLSSLHCPGNNVNVGLDVVGR